VIKDITTPEDKVIELPAFSDLAHVRAPFDTQCFECKALTEQRQPVFSVNMREKLPNGDTEHKMRFYCYKCGLGIQAQTQENRYMPSFIPTEAQLRADAVEESDAQKSVVAPEEGLDPEINDQADDQEDDQEDAEDI